MMGTLMENLNTEKSVLSQMNNLDLDSTITQKRKFTGWAWQQIGNDRNESHWNSRPSKRGYPI